MIKKFENYEKDETIWIIELEVGGHDGFTHSQVLKLGSELIEILDNSKIEYDLYYFDGEGFPEDMGVVFIFDKEPTLWDDVDEHESPVRRLLRSDLVADFGKHEITPDKFKQEVEVDKFNL